MSHYIRSASDFAQAIKKGVTMESKVLDFKRTINNWNAPKSAPDRVRQDAQMELCRDITQFANTDGGCLVVGVDETANSDGVKVAGETVFVSDGEGMRAWIEQAVANYCVPATFSMDVHSVKLLAGTILTVNVPPSMATVYIWDRHAKTIEVLARTSFGKAWLNPGELERHIMNGSRAARLSFEEVMSEAKSRRVEDVELVGGVQRLAGRAIGPLVNGPVRIGMIRPTTFDLMIPITGAGVVALTVPFGLLREVWLDASSLIHVMLHVAVHWNDRFSFR